LLKDLGRRSAWRARTFRFATDRLSLHCTIMAVAGAERIESAHRKPALPSECAWMPELAGRRKDARNNGRSLCSA
jgi:hypothetical protein